VIVLTDFLKRLGFDLTDTFACHAEFLADLLERVRYTILQSKPDTEDFLFTGSELIENGPDMGSQELARCHLMRHDSFCVFDEVTEHGIIIVVTD
jgi:hypothetical protein